ncbi:MAG TPA: hypothetical protein VFC63_09155 [Blastocatellia bacterium]|nr:hypothetical protein [Blastocatellia bacterium]
MRRNLNFCSFIFAAGILLFFTSTAHACIPIGGIEPPCSAYWKADVVFVGTVSQLKKIKPALTESSNNALVRFSVEKVHRGTESKEIEVSTVVGTDCSDEFRKGEKWLVYAHRNSARGKLEIWTRTTLYANAKEDLSYIDSLSHSFPQSSITVRAFDYPYNTLEGIKIEIEGDGFKFQDVTNKEGQLTVPILKPGKYLIRGIFPASTSPMAYKELHRMEQNEKQTVVEYQEEIKSGRCGYIEFLVYMPKKPSGLR